MTSTSQEVCLHPEWQRTGRGHQLQFFALDEELDEWLAHDLPAEGMPYRLVGFDLLSDDGRKYRQLPFVCPDCRPSNCRRAPDGTSRTSHWLLSETLSPKGLINRVKESGDLTVNGLLLIQLGHAGRGGVLQPSRIAVCDRAVNQRTGEVREHPGYRAIFNTLAKGIRKRLAYKTAPREAPQAEGPPLMTERAAEAMLAGRVVFSQAPSRRA
jgi:hypothetical protein